MEAPSKAHCTAMPSFVAHAASMELSKSRWSVGQSMQPRKPLLASVVSSCLRRALYGDQIRRRVLTWGF